MTAPTQDAVHTPSRCRPSCTRPNGLGALPGLAFVAAGTVVSFGVTHLVPELNPSTVAVVLGALAVNLRLHTPVLHAGTHLAAHRLLRIAVVLLGLQLGLPQLLHLGLAGLAVVLVTVTVTFAGTRLPGRLLGVSPARSLLIATGFSICGASAVAAMEEVAAGDDDDTGVAVALVTLCGSLAILLLPALRGPLGLGPVAFGSWVGASVHDVGQTVAPASRVPGALTSAVVVKLSRVVLLAPLVAGVALARSRDRRTPEAATVSGRRLRSPPVRRRLPRRHRRDLHRTAQRLGPRRGQDRARGAARGRARRARYRNPPADPAAYGRPRAAARPGLLGARRHRLLRRGARTKYRGSARPRPSGRPRTSRQKQTALTVLDAYAVLAYLRAEPYADDVAALLRAATTSLSAANAAESSIN